MRFKSPHQHATTTGGAGDLRLLGTGNGSVTELIGAQKLGDELRRWDAAGYEQL